MTHNTPHIPYIADRDIFCNRMAAPKTTMMLLCKLHGQWDIKLTGFEPCASFSYKGAYM